MKTKHENWKYEFTADRAWGAWAMGRDVCVSTFSTLSKFTGISILADGSFLQKNSSKKQFKSKEIDIYVKNLFVNIDK